MAFTRRIFNNLSQDSGPPYIDAQFFNELQDAVIGAENRFNIVDVDAAFTAPTIAPDPAKAGRLGIATDKMRIYRDTGTAWQLRASAEWGDIVGKPTEFAPVQAANATLGGVFLSTLTQLTNGVAGILVPTAATIKAELDRRQIVPAFAAHATAVQALTANQYNIIAFSTELFDPSNAFAANAFTAPRPGLYRFSYLVTLNVTALGTYFSALFKNGVEFQRGDIRFSGAGGPQGLVGSFLLDLAAGDVITARVFPTASVSTFTGDIMHVHFEGNFVGTKA